MSIQSDINNFVPEDCDYFQRWDDSAPLFDNFYILGPDNFKSDCEPTSLFQYPISFQRIIHETGETFSSDDDSQTAINANIRNMNDQDFKTAMREWEVIINTDGGKIAQFIFPDGTHFVENDEEFLSTDFSLIDTFSKPPKIYDSIIFIKSDGSIPHYYFCIRFKCSPFSRPSAFSMARSILYSKLANKGQNKDDQNTFNKDEIDFYLATMKEKFENEMIYFRDAKKCPTSLFAFIFETQHPCHDFFFNLIQLISRLETSNKIVALNLHNLLSSSYLEPNSEPFLNFLNKKDKKEDGDFLIIEKIDNINLDDQIDCVISIKESKEFVQNEDVKSTQNQKENEKTQQDKNDNENNENKDDNINDYFEKNIDHNENKNSESSSGCCWPENAFRARDDFLKKLYNENFFPEIGKEITISIGSSFLSKFVWQRPTTQESITQLCVYGIEPLLEWITVEEFVHILTLIFLEYDIIVAGTEVEPIVRVVSSFSHIIFPFAWMFPILTIVPDSFIDILGSPVPFIAGVFKSEISVKKFFELDDSNNILIIDMDDKAIKWPTQKHPKIASNDLYINSLKKFCTNKKKITQNYFENHHSDVLIIQNNDNKRKSNPFKLKFQNISNPLFDKLKNLNKNKKNFYFDTEKIVDVIDCVFKLNQNVFISKIYPSIITNIKNTDNECKVIGSMLVDELYVSQFEDKKNDLPFIDNFMKTQMFVSFREQSCKQKSDEESKIISNDNSI